MIKRSSVLSYALSAAGLLAPPTLYSQHPTFAVATIRPSAQEVKFERDGQTDFNGNTLRMQDVTVDTCIKLAYHVQESQVQGPDWIRSQRFDITAKTDALTDETTMKHMLEALLVERFGLVLHREQKEMKALVLTVAAKGSKLTPAAAPDAKPYRQNSANGTVAKSMPIGEFADFISGPLQMPVVDHTGLTGKYDFIIDFTPYLTEAGKNMSPDRPDATAILKAALKDELGLSMDSGRTSVEVLVIDHVEKPSAN